MYDNVSIFFRLHNEHNPAVQTNQDFHLACLEVTGGLLGVGSEEYEKPILKCSKAMKAPYQMHGAVLGEIDNLVVELIINVKPIC